MTQSGTGLAAGGVIEEATAEEQAAAQAQIKNVVKLELNERPAMASTARTKKKRAAHKRDQET